MINNIKLRQLADRVIFSALILVLVACAPQTPVATELPEAEEANTETPLESETLVSPTEVPEAQSVILTFSGDTEPYVLAQIQSGLESLVSETGLVLVVQENLGLESITSNVQVVIGVGSDVDLNAMAASSPGVSFVAIGNPNVRVTDNLSIIGDPKVNAQQQAFMAGYLSAVISTDNRVAALVPSDIENSTEIVDGFVTGVRYYCGLCKQMFPPYNDFPQWEVIGSEIAVEGFQQTIANFVNAEVEVLYVHRELATPERLAYLAEFDFSVVGDASPDSLRNNWAGTIVVDPVPALVELWPDLLLGIGGTQISASIVLTDTEAGLIPEGRYRLIEELSEKIQEGLILLEPAP